MPTLRRVLALLTLSLVAGTEVALGRGLHQSEEWPKHPWELDEVMPSHICYYGRFCGRNCEADQAGGDALPAPPANDTLDSACYRWRKCMATEEEEGPPKCRQCQCHYTLKQAMEEIYRQEKFDPCGDGFGCETDRVKAARAVGAGMNFYLRTVCKVDTFTVEAPGEALCPDGSDTLDPTLTSACDSTLMHNTELTGGTSLEAVPAAAPEQCCKLCGESEACAYWVYRSQESLCCTFRAADASQVKPSLGAEGITSGMRSSSARVGAQATSEAGAADCAAAAKLFQDQDLRGGDVAGASHFVTLNWEYCCAFCVASSECFAWTWDPDNAACGGSCCFLKASEGFTVTNAPGLVSGSY